MVTWNNDDIKTLYRHVLGQALQDTVSEGLDYFRLDNPDFMLVCELAEKSPVEVMERAYAIATGLVSPEGIAIE